MADEIQRWAKQTLFGPGGPPEGVHLDERDGYLISYPSLLRAGEAAVETAKAQIVGWLEAQSDDRTDRGEPGAAIVWNLAQAIRSGAPERWAAEREGECG